MSWTYAGTPATIPRDAVRFLCGDTNTADQLITDDEITYLLAEYPSTTAAAAAACRAIAAEFSRKADKKIGDLSLALSQRATAYAARAKELDATTSASLAPVPSAGGISIADKAAQVGDTDRVVPVFSRSGFDRPDGGDSDDAVDAYGVR